MKVGDLFKPFVDPALPPVPNSFPPHCHPVAEEVMGEWTGRSYTFDELADEVLRRIQRRKPRGRSDLPAMSLD